jgi:cytochrome c-type biogenesis protein CcmE
VKKIHLIGIIVVAIAISIIVATSSDASVYTDFGEAKRLKNDGSNNAVHVVGKLKKGADGKITDMFYEPTVDANHFEFKMIDLKGNEQKVVYNAPKPKDIISAEQVVIVGKMNGEVFECDKILLKCPSKYQDGKTDFVEQKKENN